VLRVGAPFCGRRVSSRVSLLAALVLSGAVRVGWGSTAKRPVEPHAGNRATTAPVVNDSRYGRDGRIDQGRHHAWSTSTASKPYSRPDPSRPSRRSIRASSRTINDQGWASAGNHIAPILQDLLARSLTGPLLAALPSAHQDTHVFRRS